MLENELVNRARAGEKKALEILLMNNYPWVYGYLLKLCMNEEKAKDFTQETMTRAILHIRNFKGESKFSTWLITIASNLYKDALKIKVHEQDDVEDMDALQSEKEGSLEEKVLMREKMEWVKKILSGLQVEMRKAFVLKHYYNYSYEEISKILHCPVGTVRSRIHYCIKKIRAEMEMERGSLDV